MTHDAGERIGGRFAKLWIASTTSALGSGVATIAAPLLVASRTDDPLVVSAGFGIAWLPWLLFALPGGVLVDRVDRRRLMVLIDWVRVVAMGVLTVAILIGPVSIALLYAVLFVVNTGEIVFRSASQAMIPAVVPRPLLERANGWLGGGTMLMQGMVAGPLGGFLFVVAVSSPFLVNTATYAVSAVCIALVAGSYRSTAGADQGSESQVDDVSRVDRVEESTRRSVRADIAEGFGWLIQQRLLRTMAVLIGLLNLTLTAAVAVLVLLAKERLHLGSIGYGLLMTCMAAGGILGAVVGDRLIKLVTATWTIRIGLLIEAGMHLALAASGNSYFVGFAMFAFGIHGALWSIVGNSLRQRLTPTEMMGRVASTSLFIAAGGNCVGAVLGGVVASQFGMTAPYWVGFVVAVAVTAATWHVFNRATVAAAYAEASGTPGDTTERTEAGARLTGGEGARAEPAAPPGG